MNTATAIYIITITAMNITTFLNDYYSCYNSTMLLLLQQL